MNARASAMMGKADRVDWETPDDVLELVRAFAGGPIGLDPCTTRRNPCAARSIFTPKENGLVQPWGGYGLVYCNPPYGTAAPAWTAKCVAEAAKGAEIVALLPSRTDTAWWHGSVTTATAICFVSGRLTFAGATAPAPFPSIVAYWGPLERAFRNVFGARGWIP